MLEQRHYLACFLSRVCDLVGRAGFDENLAQRIFFGKRKPITVFLKVPFHFGVGDHHAAPHFPIDDLEQRQLFPNAIRTDRIFVVDFFALLNQLLDRLLDLLVSHLHTTGLCFLELQSSFDHRGQGHRFCHFESAATTPRPDSASPSAPAPGPAPA